MSCCPPNSEPYLAPDYKFAGNTSSIGDLEFYCSGSLSGKKGILLIPDVFGWHSGRTRNVADLFAQEGYYVLVPKVIQPALEGGSDGDGLPSNFDLATRGGELGPYIKNNLSYEGLAPRLNTALRHMVDSGISKIAILGFCFGGWPMAKIISSADMPEQIVCGVSPHPSIGVEEMFGGDTAKLVAGAKRPIFLLPAGNDPDRYRPNGDVFEALKAAQPESAASLDHSPMKHGWVVRGDVTDAEVKKHVELALDQIRKFIATHMAK